MQDKKYIDLLIQNGDITLNSGSEPDLCNNQISIGQDIIHAIIESGLANQLIGERSQAIKTDIFIQITLLIENDIRIVPGSISINEESPGCLLIKANTYEFNQLTLSVNYGE